MKIRVNKLNNKRAKTLLSVTKATREAILFLVGCSEVNITLLINSEVRYPIRALEMAIHLCVICLTLKTQERSSSNYKSDFNKHYKYWHEWN